MNSHVNAIANRLSLRPPQKIPLEILARLGEIISLEKGAEEAVAPAGRKPRSKTERRDEALRFDLSGIEGGAS